MGEWTQRWIQWLRTEHNLKASTLAVYTNGVIAVSSYACALVDDASACPTQQLVVLRRQAENIANQERLFQPKSANWLSWERAQQARVACVAKWRAAKGREERQALLRDCLVMAFHTLQAPDRVGVVRRLRLGTSLYLKEGDSQYTVDLSTLRHKTSRNYGPTIHSLPASLSEWVAEWERSTELEPLPDSPYLFPMATDWSRGYSSSGWTQLVKGVFMRHAGVATPPKDLRASFCTYLRSAEDVDDELFESCAKAMKHLKATGGSGARAWRA